MDKINLPETIAVIMGAIASLILGFKKYLNKNKDKKPNYSRCSDCKLYKHKLFNNLDYYLTSIDSPDWKCINNYKTEVAKDMIRSKLSIGKKRIRDWVCANCEVLHAKDLRVSYNDMLVSVIKEYENDWFVKGINSVIITKLSNYHRNNIKYAVEIGKVELKREYNNTKQSLHHVLDILIVPYGIFMSDVRNVIDSFNGELKNDVYKGIQNTNEIVKLELSQSKLKYSFEKEFD